MASRIGAACATPLLQGSAARGFSAARRQSRRSRSRASALALLLALASPLSAGFISYFAFAPVQVPHKPPRAVRHAYVVSDESVPEGHRGLHDALYGGNSEAEHAAAAQAIGWPGRLDGSELLDAAEWLQAVRAISPDADLQPAVGLYALYEAATDDSPWMVGFSRRVQADISRRTDEGGSFVRVKLLGLAPQMWTRDKLEEERQKWAEEQGLSVEGGGWGGEAAGREAAAESGAGLSGKELQAFEERKWKLQMAMGKNLFDSAENEVEDDVLRRRNFIRAVEGDDWSGVIGEQSAQTELPGQEEGLGVPGPAPFASPFQRGLEALAAAGDVPKELTVENVRAVLEAVRPILVADGGDIEVIGVSPERGAVMLGLMGACQTCPASGETMESGVEKALMEHFGADVLKEVVRVDQGATDASPEAVRQRVEAHLAELEGSLIQEGGQASVRECAPHGCVVEFSGPPMLRQLVHSSLMHRFPELRNELVELAVSS